MSRIELGQWGEAVAAKHLEHHGWTVLARNYRTKCGEVDLIAERMEVRRIGTRRILAFVEVKTRRPRKGLPPERSVTYRKRRTITRVAAVYCRKNRVRNTIVRFDVVAVLWEAGGESSISHFPAAFDADGRLT